VSWVGDLAPAGRRPRPVNAVPGRPLGVPLGRFLLVGLLAGFVIPGAVLAQPDQLRLSLRPIGQAGPYFDLTMRAGETRSLRVEIANDGTAAFGARTYATDVYTIVNGGFGGRLRGDLQTGTTRWLDYPTAVLPMKRGSRLNQIFTVAVPAGTAPGEYITALVLENDKPIGGNGSVALDQIVRQAVAVVITVPGGRSPSLAIGAATHEVVGGRSIVSVAVRNTGNVRLKPLVTLALLDPAGIEISRTSLQMDSFYAWTDAFVEVPLAGTLAPGRYTARLTMDAEGTSADKDGMTFTVEAPVASAAGNAGWNASGVEPGPVTAGGETTGQAPIMVPTLPIALVVGVLAGLLSAGMFQAVRRRRTSNGRDPQN
jgi:hypothetical protein